MVPKSWRAVPNSVTDANTAAGWREAAYLHAQRVQQVALDLLMAR